MTIQTMYYLLVCLLIQSYGSLYILSIGIILAFTSHSKVTNNGIRVATFVVNNLISYNASANLNNLYNFGFITGIVLVIQIFSGILMAIYYTSQGFSDIIYVIKELSVGWIFRYCHSGNASIVHCSMLLHANRNACSGSYLLMATTYTSGLVLYLLMMAVSFLGYVLPFGQMSYWGATVITNIVDLIPRAMPYLLGNFTMCNSTLTRFFILHFLLSICILMVVIIHLIYLHKWGSTNPLTFTNVKVTFFPYFYAKDLYSVLLVAAVLAISYYNLVELSHSDNNVEVNQLVTPLHIVPEWYFLPYYTILKCINSKIAGILLFASFFLYLFNLVNMQLTHVLVWTQNNIQVVSDWYSVFFIFLFIGAKLPLPVYLYAAKICLIVLYLRMFNSIRQFNITLLPYFTVNSYTYYYTCINILYLVQYCVVNQNIELNESHMNMWIFIAFIVMSELLLFIGFFCLVFDHNTNWIVVNHYHLYYTGLIILTQASTLSNVYLLITLVYAFCNLQVIEYRNMAHTINYDAYTSYFYFITTLHLLHVLVGFYMILFTYNSRISFTSFNVLNSNSIINTIVKEYSVVINVYWNFVEVVWLLIFWLYSHFNIVKNEYASLNHKVIGLNYFIVSMYFGLVAILYSMLLRIELFSSGARIIYEQNNFVYNYLMSLHGLMMIFFFIMPLVYAALGNITLPININAAELKLSKLNNLSLLFLLVSFVLVINASLLEFGIGVGWTLYPPLSTYSINLSKLSLELILIGLVINGLASLLSSINFMISIFYMMNVYVISIVSIFTMAILMSAYMLIMSLPVLTSGIISLLIDIVFNTILMDPAFGGDPMLYQHLFWFFGHPEVYIMILPSFGLINTFLIQITSKSVFGASTMNLALIGITFLGFVVWAHHMYTAGMESDSRAYFTATTIMISIPTGTKVFNWLVNMYASRAIYTPYQVFIIFFVLIFVIGGVSGVMLGNASIDVLLHDTYYVVGHFHQVLAIGSVVSILTYIIIQNQNLQHIPVCSYVNQVNIPLVFTTLFININLLFFNLLWLGFNVLPRRIPDYSDEHNGWNMLASIHAIFIAVLLVVL